MGVLTLFLLYFFSIAWRETVGSKERKEGVSKVQRAWGDTKRQGHIVML